MNILFNSKQYLFSDLCIIFLLCADPPAITKSPMSHVVALNMEATLSCEASSFDNSIQYHWERKGFLDSSWTVITSARNTSYKPESIESQQYRCVATNDAGTTNSEVANITVLGKH